jgi:amidase
MQLAGPRWSEPLLLRAGHAYQSVTDWHLRRPALGERDHTKEPSNEGRR